jgi:hypothetical protein
MAILRNREVEIVDVALHIDPSTFIVRYKDGQTEYAKLHELAFTKAEYSLFVHDKLPTVKMVDEPEPKVEVKEEKKTSPRK